MHLPPLADDVASVLARAQAAGLRHCVTVGTTVEASRATCALAQAHPMLRAAVGVHPHEAETVTPETLRVIEALTQDPRVVAVGEVGLDFYRHHAAPDSQRRAFSGFLAIAQRRGLPVIIHCRDAYDALLDVLREEATPPVRGVIHCASGPPEFIHAALAFGLHISFAGNVTFPKAAALHALVPLVPEDRLLVETDAPFLAPQPVRGRPNEPAFVAHTATYLAAQRGVSMETLAARTTQNACQLFHIKK